MQQFKRLGVAVGFVALATFSLIGTGSAFSADYIAKIGHLESAQQSRHVLLEKVSKLVSERTDGAVEFQIFPQGQLGQQREMTEGVQLGSAREEILSAFAKFTLARSVAAIRGNNQRGSGRPWKRTRSAMPTSAARRVSSSRHGPSP